MIVSRTMQVVSFVFLLLSPLAAQSPQPATAKPLPILQTELLDRFATDRDAVGAPIHVRSLQLWAGAGCNFKAGTVITGHIAALEKRSEQQKGASFTVVFDTADCAGKALPIHFTLFAVNTHPYVNGDGAAPDSSAVLGYTAPKTVNVVQGGAPVTTTRSDELDFAADMSHHPSDQPKSIAKGDVKGLSKTTLSVGTGIEGGSVLSTPKGDLRLEPKAQFILIHGAAAQ